ncbi:hypothetical protein AAF712_013634 [Marasmius tenuissimus]|uniref:F-box domain-containing protein n=1 Tax=Marasmius tenuissimus TaxID=585030 RepID=A0ABR2ZGM9_9AGAR
MAPPRTPPPPIPKAEYRSIGFIPENEVSVVYSSNSQEDPQSEHSFNKSPCLPQFIDNAVNGMDRLEGNIAKQYHLITITHRLPVEVWMTIFDLCMSQSHLSVSKLKWNKVVAMPYTLSHVCSRWRNIVISFPTLWSSIDINLYALDRDIIPILDNYLTYSAYGRGLDAVIRFRASLEQGNTSTSTNMNDGWTVHASKAFSLLMLRLSSFHTLSLFGFSPQHFLRVNEIKPLALPRLRSLVLGLALPTEPNCLWSALQRAHNLTGLTFGTELRLRSAGTIEILSHSQVRMLDIRNIWSFEAQYEDILTLLPTLRSLETLKLGGVHNLHDRVVELPKAATSYTLKSLSLTFRDSESVSALLQSLELPSLESISLSCNTSVNSSSIFISTLRRFSTLESLSLNFDIDEYGVTALNNLISFLPELFSLDSCAPTATPDPHGSRLSTHPSIVEQTVSLLEVKSQSFSPNPEFEKPWMAIHLIFGAWCRSTTNLFAKSKFNERLGKLDENGIRCLVSYSSLGLGCSQEDSGDTDDDESQSPFFAMY